MKTVLILTDNPENKELIEGCHKLEEVGFRVFIDRLMDPSSLDEEQNYFSWIIFSNEQGYLESDINKINRFLSFSATPIKVIIREPLELVDDLLKAGISCYSDWPNLIKRNFFV